MTTLTVKLSEELQSGLGETACTTNEQCCAWVGQSTLVLWTPEILGNPELIDKLSRPEEAFATKLVGLLMWGGSRSAAPSLYKTPATCWLTL